MLSKFESTVIGEFDWIMQGDFPKTLEQSLSTNDNESLLQYLYLFMEEGLIEEAFDLSLKMDPQTVTLYILGQLSSGHAAINYYKQGISMDKNDNSKMTAYLAMIEIYMTDLCDEANASDVCNELIDCCLGLNQPTSDLYFAISDVRLCQLENAKSKGAVETAVNLYIENFYTETPKNIPTYDSRIKGSKVCIELGLIDMALDILKTCEYEFDEDLDMLYLTSYCYCLLSDTESSNIYLEKLKTLDLEKEYQQGIEDIRLKLQLLV